MKLNCDLGESYGAWTMGRDSDVMPLIDQANIACGFHGGDPNVMVATVKLATEHGVAIGAHPAYNDLPGFGRRSIAHTPDQIQALLWYQLGALAGVCKAFGTEISYVKPHGALNNDMMRSPALLETVMRAVARFDSGLALMIPVTRDFQSHRLLAKNIGLELIFEAFADRAYDPNGQLVPRSQPGAVLDSPEQILEQALSFRRKGGVRAVDGEWLDLPAESLCVHGDNEHALKSVRLIRQAFDGVAATR